LIGLEVPALGTLAGAPPRGVSGSPAFSAGYQPCLSLPTFAQSDRPVAKAGEPLDFGHMSDRQVNEFVASELKELNDQAALVRSALTILLTLQAAYALESDAANLKQGSSTGEKLQKYFERPLSKALEDLSTTSTANDLERASAFRVAPPK
jgi:hypothetical protein